jgi:hypothetical protein
MQDTTHPTLPLTGACQCRAVRYEIRAEPLTLYACHCTECQRQSGSAFALSMVVAREAVVTVAGKPKAWRRMHESGRAAQCLFCPECGTRLWHEPERNAAITILKPGTLDDTSWLRPVGHIWTRSAQDWIDLPEASLLYPQQQPALDDMCAAWTERRSEPVRAR